MKRRGVSFTRPHNRAPAVNQLNERNRSTNGAQVSRPMGDAITASDRKSSRSEIQTGGFANIQCAGDTVSPDLSSCAHICEHPVPCQRCRCSSFVMLTFKCGGQGRGRASRRARRLTTTWMRSARYCLVTGSAEAYQYAVGAGVKV